MCLREEKGIAILSSLTTKPLSIQEEIQISHPRPSRAIVLRELLQQAEERIFVRISVRGLGTGAQAAGSLMIERVVGVVRAEIVGPGDACWQWAEIEGRGEDALGKSLGLVVVGQS